MARSVDRAEAARAIAAARRSTDDVIVVEAVVRGPYEPERADRLVAWDPVYEKDPDDVHGFHLFELDDGSRYAWNWKRSEWTPSGQRMWCTDPRTADQVLCVRQSTILPTVEVLRGGPFLPILVGGRGAPQEPPLVDPAIVAPVDATAGTGVAQEDARHVLAREHRWQRDHVRRIALGAFSVLTFILFSRGMVGWAVAAAVLTGLIGLAERGSRGSRGAGDVPALEPVTVLSPGPGRDVQVATNSGERYEWATSHDRPEGWAPGRRVWATRLSEGAKVHLVGRSEDEGRLVLVSPQGPARRARPPEIQDV